MRLFCICSSLALVLTACSPKTEAPKQNGAQTAIAQKNMAMSSAAPQSIAVKTAKNPENLDKDELTLRANNFLTAEGDIANECDRKVDVAFNMYEGEDPVQAYDQMREAADVCNNSSSRIREITAPSYLSSDGAAIVNSGIQKLADAYALKAAGCTKFLAVTDGDVRPSVISDAKRTMRESSSLLKEALTDVINTFIDEGADPHGIT